MPYIFHSYSGAPPAREPCAWGETHSLVNPPIPENLVIMWPYTHRPPTVRPSAPQSNQCFKKSIYISTKSLSCYILWPIIDPTVVIICCIASVSSYVVDNASLKLFLTIILYRTFPKCHAWIQTKRLRGLMIQCFYTSVKEEKQRENWTPS